jgi:hypothetical protein
MTKGFIKNGLYSDNEFLKRKRHKGGDVPDNTSGLIKEIKGNNQLKDLLFNKLGWSKK